MINDSQEDIVQSKGIIELLKNPKALDFLDEHYAEKPELLALRFNHRQDLSISKLTQLLQLYKKAEAKIPLWVSERCALNAKAYAQCTHAAVAQFRSSLFSGKRLLDMTSGLGVDSYYFSKTFKEVTSLESDPTPFQFAKFNATRLGATNINFVQVACEDYQIQDAFDLIYIDPDRRPEGDQQVLKIDEYAPNIFELQDSLLAHSPNILIKLSPMVDLTFLERNLKDLSKLYVISYKNEVKEVLAHLSGNTKDYQRLAIDISNEGVKAFEAGLKPLKGETNVSAASYLIEPYRSIIKAGLSTAFGQHYGLTALSAQDGYFIHDEVLPNAMARQYRIIEEFDLSWKDIRKHLKSNKIKAINIAQRRFFEDVKSIRKRLKVAEGGNQFLFFSSDKNGNGVCFYAEPAN